MDQRFWEEKVWAIVEKGEKILLRLMVFGFVALVAVQSLHTADFMGFYSSWAERLEGEPFAQWSNSSARVMEGESDLFAYLTLELQDFSSLAKAELLINGKKVSDFRNKRVTVKLYPDDLIQVDGSFYHRPLTFEVVEVSPHLSQPALHEKVETNSNMVSLRKVKFK